MAYKIALIINQFSSQYGGLEKYAYNFCRHLLKLDVSVHVITQKTDFDPNEMPDCRPGLFDIAKIPTIKKPASWRMLSFAYRSQQHVNNLNVDVVYAMAPCFEYDVYRLGNGISRYWFQECYPGKFNQAFHYLIKPVHFINQLIEKRMLDPTRPTRLIANSTLGKQHAMTYYQYPEDRIRVVYNGVDHTIFNQERLVEIRTSTRRQIDIPRTDFVLLFAANDWERKGLRTICRALTILREKRIMPHLLIVGRGKPSNFKRELQPLYANRQVHIIGQTHHIEQYYKASDLLVLPTKYDPFSNVCLEAMACGVPVITTRSNGASDLIEHGVNGYRLNTHDDAVELARLIEISFNNPNWAHMRLEANSVAKGFSLERNALETIEMFERIVKNKRLY